MADAILQNWLLKAANYRLVKVEYKNAIQSLLHNVVAVSSESNGIFFTIPEYVHNKVQGFQGLYMNCMFTDENIGVDFIPTWKGLKRLRSVHTDYTGVVVIIERFIIQNMLSNCKFCQTIFWLQLFH